MEKYPEVVLKQNEVFERFSSEDWRLALSGIDDVSKLTCLSARTAVLTEREKAAKKIAECESADERTRDIFFRRAALVLMTIPALDKMIDAFSERDRNFFGANYLAAISYRFNQLGRTIEVMPRAEYPEIGSFFDYEGELYRVIRHISKAEAKQSPKYARIALVNYTGAKIFWVECRKIMN
ncbi:hypothetical protein HYW53_02955 [Candidatus Giovannonibacteria bacterium]|nr:hypothetical protein [Candidatus Giovannonibacteria bacterium]